jgi:hypothetical protein
MLRTSKCFAGIFFQLGGPDALQALERFVFSFLADSCSSRIGRRLSEKLFGGDFAQRPRWSARKLIFHAIGKLGPSAHNLRGEVAARCVAVG